MKTYTPDLTYFGPDYPDPPGPEKIVKYLESEGWLWDRVWQPKWKNWLFGPKYGWFGPTGTPWFLHTTPESWQVFWEIFSDNGWVVDEVWWAPKELWKK